MTESLIMRHLRQMVYEALTHENVSLNEMARAYLISMLGDFIDANLLGQSRQGMPVLTWLYRDASEARGTQRAFALKRLGDVSLFLSGVFVDYVRKTTNGLGYYIDMGCAAYSYAARASSTFNPIFDELSRKFVPLVGVLNSFAVRSSLSRDIDLDGLFELYIRDNTNLTLQNRIMSKGSIAIISTVGLN